jgi:NADH-quinone oxidoreductase subunit J
MAEVTVFLIVGGIAIAAAAMMLLSPNAVHSALFLVLNFACVAFFFITLGAPFIGLVQIAVYAGAIMVLFLFVIMMLGAERIPPSAGPYRWLPRIALFLAVLFLVTVGAAFASGHVNAVAPATTTPQVRVIHAADAPPVDVYLNNQPFAEGVEFRQATAYEPLAAGEYGVTVFPAGADPATESPAILGDLAVADGDVISVVALGADGVFQLASLDDNLLPPGDREARVTVLNGLPEEGAVDLVDPGLASVEDDSRVLINNIGFGERVESLVVEEADAVSWDVVPHDNLDADPVTSFDLALTRTTNNLLIIAPETLTTGQTRIVPLAIETPTEMLYGSPAQIGTVLYTHYLLPFIMVAILLLVAMIGALTLTHRHLEHESRPRRPVVRRSLIGTPGTSSTPIVQGDAPAEGDAAQLEPGK